MNIFIIEAIDRTAFDVDEAATILELRRYHDEFFREPVQRKIRRFFHIAPGKTALFDVL